MGASAGKKHTPWTASDICRRNDDGSTEVLRHAIRDAKGNEVVSDVGTADARDLIVCSVNARDDMLAAMKEAEDKLLWAKAVLDDAGRHAVGDVMDRCVTEVRAAIAKAEGR